MRRWIDWRLVVLTAFLLVPEHVALVVIFAVVCFARYALFLIRLGLRCIVSLRFDCPCGARLQWRLPVRFVCSGSRAVVLRLGCLAGGLARYASCLGCFLHCRSSLAVCCLRYPVRCVVVLSLLGRAS